MRSRWEPAWRRLANAVVALIVAGAAAFALTVAAIGIPLTDPVHHLGREIEVFQLHPVRSASATGMLAVIPALSLIGAWLVSDRYRLADIGRIALRAAPLVAASAVAAATLGIVVILDAQLVGQTASRSPVMIVPATLVSVGVFTSVRVRMQGLIDRHCSSMRHDAAGHGAPVVAAISRNTDPEIGDVVVSVTSTGLEHAELGAPIAEELQEACRSRRRIAKAQLDERRRIERDLHDGAQQRLLGTAAQLQAALVNGDPARMRAALELGVLECREAVVELRELARGVGPSALADGGLAVAIEQLPARFPLQATVELHGHRYPPQVESTLWFVVCEAVVNAVKHAQPSMVEVCLIESDGALRLSVSDDGSGGADRNGNGLRGLADRVEAVGGQLYINDRDANGTRIEALVPCGS